MIAPGRAGSSGGAWDPYRVCSRTHPKRDRLADYGLGVAELQAAVREQVELPAGYWIDYGGPFEQLISAAKRLSVVVPLTLLTLLVLPALYRLAYRETIER